MLGDQGNIRAICVIRGENGSEDWPQKTREVKKKEANGRIVAERSITRIAYPHQPRLKIREAFEMGIHRQQAHSVLHRECGNPEIRVGHRMTGEFRLTTEPGISQRGPGICGQSLKARQELLRLHQSLGGDFRQELTVEKLTYYRQGQKGWVMLQSQRFYAPVAAAQQFERTCINEQSHGARIPAGSPPNCSARNRPPDPDRDAPGEPRTALAQRSDSFASGRLSFFLWVCFSSA
jgi:hypothetical protein